MNTLQYFCLEKEFESSVIVLGRVSITVAKHHKKASWGAKDLFELYFHIIMQGSQDRNSNRV